MAIVLAADPGVKGGWCLIQGEAGTMEGASVLNKCKFTEEEDFYVDIDNNIGSVDLVILEKVHSMPQQGVATTFTFGSNYGFMRGVLHSLYGKAPTLVTPQTWQAYLGLKRAKNKTEHKNNLKDKAHEHFPGSSFTHATADAALIALHGLLRFDSYV